MCNNLTFCLLVKSEASAVRWGWMHGLLIAETFSYIRGVWAHSNRSLSLIYPPAQPSLHRLLAESMNVIWLPASQQLCDRKSILIIWQILYAHVCMCVCALRMHAQKRPRHVFTLTEAIYLDWTVSCRLYSWFLSFCEPVWFLCEVAWFAAFSDL